MFIYLITNRLNGKKYIGQTRRSISWRWRKHVERASAGFAEPICSAIRKYGRENFIITQLAKVDSPNGLEWLDLLEPLFIKAHTSLIPTGYNLQSGGRCGTKVHPETRNKQSIRQKGKPTGRRSPMRGRKLPPERIEQLRSQALGNKYGLGRKHSDEAKARISAAHKGRQWHLGFKHSDESKAKMSAAQRGHSVSATTRAKISAANKGVSRGGGKAKSAEHKAKLSLANTGKVMSPETRARMSAGQKRRWASRFLPLISK